MRLTHKRIFSVRNWYSEILSSHEIRVMLLVQRRIISRFAPNKCDLWSTADLIADIEANRVN